MPTEWSHYYHEPDLRDVDVLHARFVEHRFARHTHDYFVVGYVESGAQAYTYRGARHVTPAGRLFLVNPAESHTGEAATPQGYVYRTMYPRMALMQEVAHDLGGRDLPPFFREAVIDDPLLVRLVARFHYAVAEQRPRLVRESLLRASLARLILRHAEPRAPARLVGREREAVRRARDFIEAHFDADISLSELALLAGLSPFHFARAFRAATSLPPHAYLEATRIREARALLDGGKSIVEVGLAVGYSDQSHFSRRFKRVLGITPGQYLRVRRGICLAPLPDPTTRAGPRGPCAPADRSLADQSPALARRRS